ncbi:hypothetical protein KUV80_10010 [Fictibacillus nanhaiensis]|uniref:hypothetical protein n=1 Tax=Fictibacillus nanhaiensis TaxID=742169 RepID=UPI001C977EA9|nr:hypothetical protein [Fictibacillus nanhaiensis]MBY6036991.1 hypothetical protein [Fictibacillus nanhaiensis]
MFGKRINLEEIGKQQSIYLKLTGAFLQEGEVHFSIEFIEQTGAGLLNKTM